MTGNPLFYQSIVPLDRERHGRLRLEPALRPYGFAEAAQFVPALVDEFPSACRELAIVFLQGPQRPSAAFVVGLSAGRNLLVTREGRWDGTYVPAFLRRYPFIRGDIEGAEPVVCIDRAYEGLNEESGEAFFDEGKPTPYLDRQVGFVNAYYDASRKSEDFCDLVQKLGLLKPVTIDVRSQGATSSMHGLFSIDEDKLDALPGREFDKLRKSGALKAIYAQVLSMEAIGRLSARLDAARERLDA